MNFTATLRPFSCGHRVAVTTFDHPVTTFLFAVEADYVLFSV